jgi:hypothetical protein
MLSSAGWREAADNSTLLHSVLRVRGVYYDQQRRTAAGEAAATTVLMTTANAAYLPFLRAWMCAAGHHGLQYLVMTQAPKVAAVVAEVTHAAVYTVTGADLADQDSAASCTAEQLEALAVICHMLLPRLLLA